MHKITNTYLFFAGCFAIGLGIAAATVAVLVGWSLVEIAGRLTFY
jgi:hypothetical protein